VLESKLLVSVWRRKELEDGVNFVLRSLMCTFYQILLWSSFGDEQDM
jgi:hypothetical protein